MPRNSGPRIVMRLTADLIERSAAFTNALSERELDLRSKFILIWPILVLIYVIF